MKWIYKKPMIFPQWTKFKGNEKNEEYYSCENDGIVFSAESGKLSHSNHIEMAELQKSIDFIDWKQNFYDDVLLGKTEYISNLIDTNNPDQ